MYLLLTSHLCKHVSTGCLIYCTFMPITIAIVTYVAWFVLRANQKVFVRNLQSIVLLFLF